MGKKKYSAAEIAAMNLPGLPTTKANVLARAEKEAWPYETTVGRGGARKMFEIPSAYQADYKPYENDSQPLAKPAATTKVVGAITGGAIVNSKQLATAMRALDEYLKENGLVIDEPEVKAKIVAILYKYLQKGAEGEDVQELLQVMMR
ncbi:MAG: hypothetical protein HY253_06680 [Burkholderiales bacterium]|nr:hypothetical protein [Burkholderiales bacterium]